LYLLCSANHTGYLLRSFSTSFSGITLNIRLRVNHHTNLAVLGSFQC
jgi:hypothetical protein